MKVRTQVKCIWLSYARKCSAINFILDQVCMYEEMMTNNDNVESSLPTSNLLKICSLYNFCYNLHKNCRVLSSMMCVVQVTSVGNI